VTSGGADFIFSDTSLAIMRNNNARMITSSRVDAHVNEREWDEISLMESQFYQGVYPIDHVIGLGAYSARKERHGDGQERDDQDAAVPITSIKQLIDTFFGELGTFRPLYSYAQAQIPPTRPATAPLNDMHIALLTHDCVLHFLAPHEILSLWQSNKTTWSSMVHKQRRFIMIRSVFHYFRISEEAARHVENRIIGGWNAYCPLMIVLCQHLARIYGNFEPDVAHRVFMAHQACFYPWSRGRGGSAIAEHELRLARTLDIRDRRMIFFSRPASKLPPPTMDVLKMDSSVGWGDIETYCRQTANKSDFMVNHQYWMENHVTKAPNNHYRDRLEKGLSPCIWVDQSMSLSHDIKVERRLWCLGIGPERQQFLGGVVSTPDSELHESSLRHYCLEYDPLTCSRNGFMELLLRRAVAIDELDFRDDPSWPALGILVWSMRHGLEPFNSDHIDWKALVDDVCRPESEMFRRFYREGLEPWDPFGLHPPRPDPVDRAFVERERKFYMDALTSPIFGPADFTKYL
jgi:hypothetical protein